MKCRTPNDDNYGTPVIFCWAYVKDVMYIISFTCVKCKGYHSPFLVRNKNYRNLFLKSLVSLIGWLDSHQKFVDTFFKIRAAAGKYQLLYNQGIYFSVFIFFRQVDLLPNSCQWIKVTVSLLGQDIKYLLPCPPTTWWRLWGLTRRYSYELAGAQGPMNHS